MIYNLVSQNKDELEKEANLIAATRTDDLYKLPDNLPIPKDDGACMHLLQAKIPSLELESTNGERINLFKLGKPIVLFCYPRTGRPDSNPPLGWNDIPGARGCTPQACTFRDLYAEFKPYVKVFGLSTQSTAYQQEAKQRLHLPFDLLSDQNLIFTQALSLPTFKIAGMTLIKRLTLIIGCTGEIKQVLYPIFPPTLNAPNTLKWIKSNLDKLT